MFIRLPLLRIFALLAATFGLTATAKHEGSYLRDLTMEFETPHLEWGTPLAGGALKSLFIVPRSIGGREVIEMAQRMELDYTAVTTRHDSALAVEDMYESAIEGTTIYEKTQELLGKLQESYEVIVIGNFTFRALPVEAQYYILRQVSEGAGLVLVHPRPLPFKKMLANPIDEEQSVLDLVSLDGLLPKAAERGEDILATYGFGEGRIAVIDYKNSHGAYYGGLSLTPQGICDAYWKARYENNLAFIGRTLLWAAGRQAPISLTAAVEEGTLTVDATGAGGGKVTVDVRLRDAWNEQLQHGQLAIELGPDGASESLRLKSLPAGTYTADLIVRQNDQVITFGFHTFEVESSLPAAELSLARESMQPGEENTATMRWAEPLPGAVRLLVEFYDSPYRRSWWRQEVAVPAGSREATISFPRPWMPTIAGYVNVSVVSGGEVAQRLERELFLPTHDVELFPWIVWNSVPDMLAPIYAQAVVQQLGWRAGLTHPSADGENARVAALQDQRFVPYMTRIMLQAQTEEGREGWVKQSNWFFLPKEKKAEAEALEDQSWYRPEVRQLWRDGIEHRITNLPKYGPFVYTLGDENHFSYEAGFSPADNAAFRQFLAQRYGSLDALNQAWNGTFTSFDEVPHLTDKEAREAKNPAAWLDHRIFVEHQYADIHHGLAEDIREIDPYALVGAEGSVPGDLEYTIERLDFWGPYSNEVMDEVLRSLAPEKLRMLWWGGYVGSHGGRAGFPMPLWRPLLQGTVNGSAWYAASPGTSEGLASDLSLPEYVRAMLPALEALDGGLAPLLVTSPLADHGIAIHWSHLSDSMRLYDERNPNPRDSMAAFMRVCYSAGLNFDFIPTGRLEKGELGNARLLFLFGSSVVTDAEAAAIEAFVNGGGTVIADLNPGILDGFGRPRPVSALAKLFGQPELKGEAALTMAPIDGALQVGGDSLAFRADKALTSPETPALQRQVVGQGQAILLNFNLSAAESTASAETPLDGFLRAMIAAVGIEPPVRVDGIDGSRAVIRLRDTGSCHVLGLLAAQSDVGKTATFTLPEEAIVYRTGVGPFTKGASWQVELESPFQLFTIYETEPTAPAIALASENAPLGSTLDATLSNLLPGSVVRLELLGPDGQPLQGRTAILPVTETSFSHTFHIAFSDPAGACAVKVTDVASGLAGEAKLTLK